MRARRALRTGDERAREQRSNTTRVRRRRATIALAAAVALNEAAAAYAANPDGLQPPPALLLDDFEHQPTAERALQMYYENSGLWRFAQAGNLPTSDEDPSLLGTDEAALPPAARELLQDIRSERPQPSDLHDAASAFNTAWDYNQPLYTCACCGVRTYPAIVNVTDEFAWFDLDDRRVDVLAIPDDSEFRQLLQRLGDHARVSSVYNSGARSYYLYPSAVSSFVDDAGRSRLGFRACDNCTEALDAGVVPPDSLAAGMDFGDPEALGLPELTLAERLLIAPVRLHNLAVRAPTSFRGMQYGKASGHVIAFPHEGPLTAASFLRRLPDPAAVVDMLSVTFVGPDGRPSSLEVAQQLVRDVFVRPDVVYRWLRILRAVNPFYESIEVDESPQTRAALEALPQRILEAAQLVSDEHALHEDARTQDNIATAVLEEGAPAPPPSGSVQYEGLLVAPSPGLAENVIGTLTSLRDALADMSSDDTSSNGTAPQQRPSLLTVRRDASPLSDFSDNNRIIMGGFPWLFVTGCGVPTSGSLAPRTVARLMRHYTTRFSADAQLVFTIHNQKQRIAALQSVRANVHTHPRMFQQFRDIVRDPQAMIGRIEQAIQDPAGSDARTLLRDLKPIMRLTGRAVPYSTLERRSCTSELVAMVQRYGVPGVYITFAPDESQHALVARIAFPSRGHDVNAGFPAHHIVEELHARARGEHDESGDTIVWRGRVSEAILNNPVAAADLCSKMAQHVFEKLVGLGIASSYTGAKSNPPLQGRTKGIFGTPVAHYSVSEVQARMWLHWHGLIWCGLPPWLLQRVSAYPLFVREIRVSLDAAFSASIAPEHAAADLLRRVQRQPAPRYAQTMAPPVQELSASGAYRGDISLPFLGRSSQVACACNGHTHHPTCEKGPRGEVMCRLSMPQPIALETGPVELDVPSGAPYSTVSDVPATVAHAAIPVDDPRLVVYRVKRPLNNPWSLSSDQELVTAAWERAQTGTPLPDASIAPPLPNALRDQFAQYSARDENRRNAELLLAAFIRYNTSITDYNPVLSALLASNTAIYMMGTMEQAKSALMYLIKYVTKGAFSLSASLVVLLAAARYCSTHPSRAADAGTEQRGLLYLFQRMVNAIVGSSETSICQALAHILEYPAHFTSDRFIVVFVDAAVAFAREGWMQERGRSPEDAWARVNAPTFAYDSDDRELLGESDDDSVASARPATAGVARQAVPPSAATASASDSDSDSDDASTRSARPPAPDMGLDEERDLAHAASAAAANEESGFGTAPVYRLQDDGSIVPVPQHLNYSLRGEALRAVALVEYACIIEVVRRGDDDDGGIESGGSVAASGRHRAGRRPNTVFRFDARHPLAETHVQRLRSQQRTPIFAGSGVPAYPGPPPSDPSARWLTRARRFATYILTAYEPWDTATGLPTFDLEHPWDDFIAFMARSLASSDFIIVNRALTIRGLARSLRINKQRADAAAAFRNCAARRWRHPVPVDPLDDLTRALRATGFAVDDHDYDERGEREEQRQLNLQALDEVMRALAGAEAPTDRALAHLQRERDFIERTLAMFQQCWGPAPAPQAAGAAIPASALSLAAQAPLDDDGNERALHDIASAVRRYDAPPDAPPQAHASVDAHAPAPVAGAGLQLGPANVELQRLTALPADAGRPNDDQRAALHIVAEDNLDQRLRAASGSGAPPSQLLLLVHGGPGVGKSFFAQKVRQLCRAAGVDFVFCAPTGIAAANVRGGVTFNRLFKLPVKSTTLKRLQVMENNRLRALLQSCGVLFIDEISMAKAHEIAFIDERIRTALGSRVAFGGVNVIFGGDMMQLPPVGGKCMYELVALDNARDAATRVGADLFAKARLVRLTQQMRASSDLVHSGLIQRMRDAADLQLVLSELRPYLLGHVLTPERVAAEPQWRFATVATLGNPERHAINQAQAKAWALMHNQPYVTWQQQVRIAGVDPLSTGSADGMARFVELNPALVQVWTDGAPGICTDNVQPSVGISNGTRFTQRSLWLADPAQMRDLEQALSEARGFCEIRLPAGVVPGVVTVDLAVDDVDEWDDNIIVSKRLRDASAADDRRGFVTVPLEADMYPSEEDVVLPGSLKKKSVRLFGPPVELFFAATVNKVQGQTLDRLLLSLVIRGHGDMRRPTFKSLLVLLTRVRHGDHFACTPLPPGETLDWVIGSQARPAAGPVVEGL